MKFLNFLLIFFTVFVFGQNIGFSLLNNQKKEIIPFRFINNLIFIPVNINGVELTFLLDTGVHQTVLFSLDDKEINFKNVEKMKFSGLGENIQIEGLKSDKNVVSIGKNFSDPEQTIYIILNEDFNFSSHIGIPVHGILGYNFFKNYPVQIDYISHKITIYESTKELKNKLQRFAEFPIQLELNKPYIYADVEMTNEKKNSKLLVDLGNSDAIWLFPSLIKNFVYNRPNIEDFLGRGFNGDIFGRRSRIHHFYLGNFKFHKPLTAMPDEYSIQNVIMAGDRKGSVGGEIMRRFTVVFNYPEKKMYLKKNKHFSDPFYFNKSGLDFKHEGMKWEDEYVKVDAPKPTDNQGSQVNLVDTFRYQFVLKPLFSIAGVRKNSAAEKAGLKKGDLLLKINGKKASNMTLEELQNLMSHKENGDIIHFDVIRNSETLSFKLILEDPIPYQEN